MSRLICAITLILIFCGAGLGQDIAKSDKPKDKPIVTTATLTSDEITEGKSIMADAQTHALAREAAVRVFTERVKNTPEARLLAYDTWWAAAQSLDNLQVKLNKLLARAQERTGCADCGIDMEKGILSKTLAK